MQHLKTFIITILTVTIIVVSFGSGQMVNANSQQELDEIQRELERIKQEQAELEQNLAQEKSQQGEINNQIRIISTERDLIQAEINQKELELDQLNLQIEILNETIIETEQIIEKTELEIEELKVEAQEQLSKMYVDTKTNNANINLIFSESSENFVRNEIYQQVIQADTNNSLARLEDKSIQLEEDKIQLEEDSLQIAEDRKVLAEETIALEGKRSELQGKLNEFVAIFREYQRNINSAQDAYSQLSEAEQQLQARITLLQQQISDNITEIGSGQFVEAGTIIGIEGNSGVSTGPHLHFAVRINGGYVNPCSVLPPKQLRNTSCGGSSQLPNWPMNATPFLTSGYRAPGRANHFAIDVSNGGGTPIIAAHSGWITYTNDNACSWYTGPFPCNGIGANMAIICENRENCNQGIKTEYLHLK